MQRQVWLNHDLVHRAMRTSIAAAATGVHYSTVPNTHRDRAESELTFTYGFGQESEAVEILHFCPDPQRFPGVMYGYIGVYSQLTL